MYWEKLYLVVAWLSLSTLLIPELFLEYCTLDKVTIGQEVRQLGVSSLI